MKILLINKFHYERDGVTTHYFALAKLLQEHGHEVAFFSTNHPQTIPSPWQKFFPPYTDLSAAHGWKKAMRTAFSVIYNQKARENLRKLLAEFKPDIAHLHNVYYHLTPSIIDELHRQGIPMVMTLHDYQAISPNYSLFLRGKVWEKTKKHKYYWCVIDKSVKNSYTKSMLAALEAYIHWIKGSYAKVHTFISPSAWLRDIFRDYGFKGAIEVLPHPVPPLDAGKGLPDALPTPYLLYYGRLSEEKGIDVLLKALCRTSWPHLVIAGQGPYQATIERFIKVYGLKERVTLKGFLPRTALPSFIKNAAAVVVPSVWYENYPYTVIESLAIGTVVIASSIGGIPELITHGKNGILFAPGDDQALAQAIERLTEKERAFLANNARASAAVWTDETFYRALMHIYAKAIDDNRKL